MKYDPHSHKERFEAWKNEVVTEKQGINGISAIHSRLIIEHLLDMERGSNVANGSKRGGRSYIRLNSLRFRLIQIFKLFEKRGVKDISKAKESEVVSLFDDLCKGRITRQDGKPYASVRDHIKDFSSFWHWLIKVQKKKGRVLNDFTQELGVTKQENSFVYFTKEQLEQMLPYFTPDEQARVLFMYDSIIRSPTELQNIRASDLSFDLSEVNIRQETAKTFGRRIKLLLCKDAMSEYLKRNNFKNDDYIFLFSPPQFNKKIKQVALQIFGDRMTPGGKPFSKISMYDFRHSGAIYWRLGAYRSKIDALMYRGGWNNLEMLNYYTKKLGMKDSVEKEDLLIGADKNALEKKIESLEKQLNAISALFLLQKRDKPITIEGDDGSIVEIPTVKAMRDLDSKPKDV